MHSNFCMRDRCLTLWKALEKSKMKWITLFGLLKHVGDFLQPINEGRNPEKLANVLGRCWKDTLWRKTSFRTNLPPHPTKRGLTANLSSNTMTMLYGMEYKTRSRAMNIIIRVEWNRIFWEIIVIMSKRRQVETRTFLYLTWVWFISVSHHFVKKNSERPNVGFNAIFLLLGRLRRGPLVRKDGPWNRSL